MKSVLFLSPVFKETIWGGDRLASDYGYAIPSDHTGECWAISAHPNGDCRIATGEYAGKSLSELWNNQRELFGNYPQEQFPLLVKIIDAKADLSIQVHPDDAYARVHEHGSLGKTECWYIVDCDKDATIVIGHHAKNHEEMEEMIRSGRWNEFIRVIPIKKGDFFQIEPGCLHAIKTGTVLLETQQSSDITYRVYDYDRLSDGKPRQLHIQQSIDVIQAPFVENKDSLETKKVGDSVITKLVTCPYYIVHRLQVKGSVTIANDRPFVNVSVLEGEGSIQGIPIKKGDHFIIPSGFGDYDLQGELLLITSTVPDAFPEKKRDR